VMKDPQTRVNKYLAGELDMTVLDRSQFEAFSSDPKFSKELVVSDRAGVNYFVLSPTLYKPFSDVRVRRALAMSVDVEKITKEYLRFGRTATGFLPPGVLGFREKTARPSFDPVAARKLLAEAGLLNAKGLPPLEITFREQSPEVRIAVEAAASMWKEHLNFDVKLRSSEWRALLERRTANQLPMWYWGWVADYLDPQNFLSLLFATHPYGAENYAGYSNKRFDELCKEADTILDEKRRLELYAQAEDILLQDAVCIPVTFSARADLVKPHVKGLRATVFELMPHHGVRIER
jgi:oligopeptide transport system substrate-binding protein